MRKHLFASCAAALALATTLVACGGAASTYSQVTLTEGSGVKVAAQNAGSDQKATSAGAITVKEGDVIVISPNAEKGSFHLTITSSDGKTTVYDDEASGKVMYTVAAAPGTYDVATSGNGVTGEMTVMAMSQEDLIAQNQDLANAIAQEGMDPSSVLPTDGTSAASSSTSAASSSASATSSSASTAA